MVAAVMVPIVRTAASVQENTESVPQSCPRTTAASGQATAGQVRGQQHDRRPAPKARPQQQ
ncbi:hypothetical protein J113_20465 [Mycobacterium tuberculosis CAS/NITR204]|uniref:Uncharacterized protein n=1 Tax=Mycobacterium tuberculosis CAS/NITR204 TaxID=1310114 RepID=R4MLM4_MYCTX|nr:hypothetical protein J113_20465 [Mycobacterium tuberculosis CAS/NITR204]